MLCFAMVISSLVSNHYNYEQNIVKLELLVFCAMDWSTTVMSFLVDTYYVELTVQWVWFSLCVCSVAQCLTFWDPMDSSPPGSFVYGISQARILEHVAISSSKGSSWPRDWTPIYCICIADDFFSTEPLEKPVV